MVIFDEIMNKVSRFFLLTALLFSFFSCGKTDVSDNGVVDNPTGGDIGAGNTEDEDIANFKISMNVTEASKYSRASIDENLPAKDEQLQVRWDSGDKVRMMAGNFEYVGNRVETNYYYGIYPPMEIGTNGEVQLNVPIDGTISQAAADDSRHLGQFRPMYAPPVRNEEGGNVLTGVVFRHLTSLVIFKVTNSTDEAFNLNSIEMSTADGNAVFYSSASFNPQNQTEAVVKGSPNVSVALAFDNNGMQVASQEMKKAYLPVLPSGDFSKSQLRVRAITDKGEFITELPIAASETLKKFQAGSYCIFNLKKTTTGFTVEMEIQGWEDGEIVDVPLIMKLNIYATL